MLNPGQLFQCRATRTQGDEEDIAAQIGAKDGEQFGSRHLAVAHDLDGRSGANAEAGIVAEEIAHADHQQYQRDDCHDHYRGSSDSAHAAGGNEPAPHRNASAGAQKSLFFAV